MNRAICFILTLGVMLGAPAAAGAGGTGAIEGTVVDGDGAVLAGGKVRLAIDCGAVHRVIAVDGAGRFRLSGLPEGACTLSASGAGFAPVRLQVVVVAGAIAPVLVGMAPPAPPPPPREAPMPDARAAEPAPAAAAAPPMPMPLRPMRKIQRRPIGAVADGGGAGVAAPPMAPPPRLVRLDPGPRQRERARPALRQLAKDEDDGEMANAQIGWAPVRVFPVPQYTAGYDGPRNDFRETIYWNPSVETDASGSAEVAFVASDAVTAFRATAEGFSATGSPGAGRLAIRSKLPLSLDARVPVEVSAGDTVQLPVTITNETTGALDATLTARFGAAFKPAASPAGALRLAAGEKRTVVFPLDVVGSDGSVALVLASRGLEDRLERTVRVVPRGFPFTVSAAGTAARARPARHELDLAGALPGSIRATVTMYPSPVAALTAGMDGMIREPGGCFEQTSSTNYPNVMILGYLGSTDAADPALIERTRGVLDRGYKLLTGYETAQRGYEWFGHSPGHEALTAYGLMEFADMAKVHDVDRAMIERTADWLTSRRDGKGGFSRSQTALDSFGRASELTTNAYIMWALAEAGRAHKLTAELAAQKALGRDTRDPYLLALASNTNLIAAPAEPDTAAMVARLAGLQGKDGGFAGAKESITMSGGDSLAIETTALAVLALIKASPRREHEPAIRAGVEWLQARRGGYGQWGNTQATVLGLKALTAYAEHARQMMDGGSATLIVNGKPAGTIAFDKGRRDALVWDDLAAVFAPGRNTVELRLDGSASLPYTVTVEYRSARPQSSDRAKVALTTELAKARVGAGEGIKLRARIDNRTSAGIPMTLARIGIPGGAVFQTWQLKELRERGLIDFYETRPREVIVYWRALPPSASKQVELDLLATVPGSYEAPASSAYLYYTAEDKAWTAPVALTIER